MTEEEFEKRVREEVTRRIDLWIQGIRHLSYEEPKVESATVDIYMSEAEKKAESEAKMMALMDEVVYPLWVLELMQKVETLKLTVFFSNLATTFAIIFFLIWTMVVMP